jgi:hypothetical protein
LILLEAAIGIEPMNKGFAVLKSLFFLVVPNDTLSPYAMITVTKRKDCRFGIRVEVKKWSGYPNRHCG